MLLYIMIGTNPPLKGAGGGEESRIFTSSCTSFKGGIGYLLYFAFILGNKHLKKQTSINRKALFKQLKRAIIYHKLVSMLQLHQ